MLQVLQNDLVIHFQLESVKKKISYSRDVITKRVQPRRQLVDFPQIAQGNGSECIRHMSQECCRTFNVSGSCGSRDILHT